MDQSLLTTNDEIDRMLTFALHEHAIQIWEHVSCIPDKCPGVYVAYYKTLDDLKHVVKGGKRIVELRFIPAGMHRMPPRVEGLLGSLDPQKEFVILEKLDVPCRDKMAVVPLDQKTMFGTNEYPDKSCDTISAVPGLCTTCGAKDKKMKKCALCGHARYCGKDCQTKHWPEHKAACAAYVAASKTKPQ